MQIQTPGMEAVQAAASPALRRMLQGRAFDSYGLVAYFPVLGAGDTETVSVNVPANADLIVTDVRAVVIEQAAPATVAATPPVTIQVRSTGNDRSWYNVAPHLRTVAGTAERPGELTPFRQLSANSTLQVTLSNLGATDYTVWMTFQAVQVFTASMPY